MQRCARRWQCGAADCIAALPGGGLARRRAGGLAAVEPRAGSSGARNGMRLAAAARPVRLGRTPAHHQHEHHRRRPAARGLAGLRAEDRGRHRLQQQPGGGGAAIAARWPQGFAARRPVHRGAGALHDRHRRPSGHTCCRPPRSWSTWDVHGAYGHTQRAAGTSRRLRRSGRERGRTPRIFRDAGAHAWVSPSRVSADDDETHRPRRLQARARAFRPASVAPDRLGSRCRCPMRRLPTAVFPTASGKVRGRRACSSVCPTMCRTTKVACERRPSWPGASRSR